MGRDMSRKTTETLTCETSVGKWIADGGNEGVLCYKAAEAQVEGTPRLNGVNSGVHERAKMRLRRCQRLFSQYASILLSLGCLSQRLNNDLLETVNYSALKQKLIPFLIIWIRLMDEYLKIARQAVKTKTIISSHYLSLQIRIITTLQPSK